MYSSPSNPETIIAKKHHGVGKLRDKITKGRAIRFPTDTRSGRIATPWRLASLSLSHPPSTVPTAEPASGTHEMYISNTSCGMPALLHGDSLAALQYDVPPPAADTQYG
jgi:hypothetical protein